MGKKRYSKDFWDLRAMTVIKKTGAYETVTVEEIEAVANYMEAEYNVGNKTITAFEICATINAVRREKGVSDEDIRKTCHHQVPTARELIRRRLTKLKYQRNKRQSTNA